MAVQNVGNISSHRVSNHGILAQRKVPAVILFSAIDICLTDKNLEQIACVK